jgi:hypothetical protein
VGCGTLRAFGTDERALTHIDTPHHGVQTRALAEQGDLYKKWVLV